MRVRSECCAVAMWLCMMSAAAASLAVEVPGTSARLRWSAASGPVAGYRVQVSRRGSAFAAELSVPGPLATVSGVIGDTLLVRVAAYDAAGRMGPVSAVSEPITFVAAPRRVNVDLDGNGRADALAVDRGTGALTAVLLEADGTRRWVNVGAPRDPAMRPVGFADVDGDARPDVLWRNATTGTNELWLMRGLTYSIVSLPAKPSSHRVVAFRDFSSDQLADVLWHDSTAGASQLWLLGRGGYRGALAIDRAPLGAHLAAVADVNGDRAPDLVWQNSNTGALDAWLMAGAVARSVVSLGTAPLGLAAVGDLDGNGVEDLVWRRASPVAAIDAWFLSASGRPQVGSAATLLGGTELRGVADLDSDGKDDLVLGTRTTLLGLAVLPVRRGGASAGWQTRSLPLGTIPVGSWRFLALD